MAAPRRVKAVVFDLDDTLLHDDLSISPFTVQTMLEAQRSGMHVIAASGRAQMSMKPFVDRLGSLSVYIACNGAEIRSAENDELIHGEFFSAQTAREIASFGAEHHVYAQTYDGSHFYYNEHSEYAERYAAASVLTGVYVGDLRTFIREERNKILMMADERKIADMLQEARARFRGRVSVTCSKPYFLEFNPLRATKGIALEYAASLLGFSLAETIAFGDSLNDLPMLETAGWSVAVSNARREVREQCDDVCGTNGEDGVAHYLSERVLNRRERI
jgi:hypothetical protein